MERDKLNRYVDGWEIEIYKFFENTLGNNSGPKLELEFKELSASKTSIESKDIEYIEDTRT